MMYDYWAGYGGLGFIWPMINLAVWVIVVFAILRFVGNRHHWFQPEKPEPSAVDILKARYAKGEIDTAEFDERMKVVTKQGTENK